MRLICLLVVRLGVCCVGFVCFVFVLCWLTRVLFGFGFDGG